MKKIAFIVICALSAAPARILNVEEVRVDSIWNSDSSWYNENGVLQKRVSRDCIVSFLASSRGTVACSLSLSLDSGKTWDQPPNPLRIIDTSYGDPTFPVLQPQQSKPFPPGVRKRYRVRIYSGDRDGAVFKVVCRQYVPGIAGKPRVLAINGPAGSMCRIPLRVAAVANASIPQSPIGRYYWDFLGDGFWDDSTSADSIEWKLAIPDSTQSGYARRAAIVYARDSNNIASPPETLTVEFNKAPGKTVFSDGFEGDLSKWRPSFLFSAMEPSWPGMTITTDAAHGGTHSVMGDSNRTALYKVFDSCFKSGIVGLQFFIMAKTAEKINLSVIMGKDCGSSGGLYQEFGMGFDTSNSIISIYENPDDPTGIGYYNEKHLPIEANYWYKCVAEADFATDTVSYYIDDVRVRTAYYPLQQSMGIDAVLLIRGRNGEYGEPGVDGAKPCYADDIRMYTR